MGHSAADAEDLVQDLFVTFLATLDRFEGRSSVYTWLFGILLRKSQERGREREKDARHDSIEEEWAANFDAAGTWVRPPLDPDRALQSREAREAIGDCLPRLAAAQRDVFLLRVVEEISAAEAGKILGLTVTHIGVLLHRARLHLRGCLRHKGWKVDPS